MKQTETTTLRAHQIQEGLEGKAEIFIASDNVNQEKYRPVLSFFGEILRGSQKFLLTENLSYPPDGETFGIIPEATNLPAQSCYFERTQKGKTWGAVCMALSTPTELMDELGSDFIEKQLHEDPEGKFKDLKPKWTCWLFVKSPERGIWSALPYSTTVCLDKDEKVKLTTESLLVCFGAEDSKATMNKDVFEKLSNAATSEILWFLQMLSCSNVTMRTIEKPKALNKKRALRNMPQIDSYKVLQLPMHGKAKYEGQEHSDRNSPRAHFRRGHVRRLSPNQNTWVQHCFVGDASKGTVTKTYKA